MLTLRYSDVFCSPRRMKCCPKPTVVERHIDIEPALVATCRTTLVHAVLLQMSRLHAASRTSAKKTKKSSHQGDLIMKNRV